jgi:spore coat polysaccharide biosynthesis predicted glycosyltransferase SpsG
MALATELRDRGADVIFACRAEDFDVFGAIAGVAETVPLRTTATPETDAEEVARLFRAVQARVLVVDHYYADLAYQRRLAAHGVTWLQFDRRAAHPFLARWVLNVLPSACPEAYKNLVADHTTLLLGPEYALLRSEFATAGEPFRVRSRPRRVVLACGGGDDRGALKFFLEVLATFGHAFATVALVGGANPRLPEIRHIISTLNGHRVDLRIDEMDVAGVMAGSDLAVISAGTLAFETASIGVPSVLTAITDNQEPVMSAWQEHGAGHALGSFSRLSAAEAARVIEGLLVDEARRAQFSRAGRRLVDGRGARRVANALLGS